MSMRTNVVYYKDARDMSEVDDSSVRLIVTSPPYFNIKDYSKDGYQQRNVSERQEGQIGDIDDYESYLNALDAVWAECLRVLKPNGKLCINVPLMPMEKAKLNTHYNRDIFNINSGIEDHLLRKFKGKIHLLDVYIWNRTNPTKRLMFGSYPYPPNFYVTAVAQALNTLELSFHLTFTADGFNQSFHQYSYNLAVVDTPNYHSVTDAAADYVEAGGRLIMSYWAMNYHHDHRIWPMLGVVYGGDTLYNPIVNIWDSDHPVFQTPFDFGVDSFTPNNVMYGDDGDTLHVLDNATALAGNSTLPAENKSLIVMRNDGRTLLNSFIIDALVGDSDLSGYQDSYELWTNEIAYFFKPLIDHPGDTTYEL